MKKISEEILRDIEKETVDWQDNYDGAFEEPTFLPTRVPNLLINGSTGIAVGMATNIPPHNLTEVMNALIALVENPQLDIHEIMKMIPGPDFPTAGSIQGLNGIKQAYHHGKGIIQIRAKAEIETYGKGGEKERIIVSELPYQVNKAKLIEKIAELVHQKELTGISDIKDESNREGIRISIELKKGEPSSLTLNRLYKMTQMQVSFGIIFLSLHNGQPKVLNIKEMLQYFIEHRREVILRRTTYELKKAKERAHVLEGLKIAVENIDPIKKRKVLSKQSHN
jgi:DNA gyrase subunit A